MTSVGAPPADAAVRRRLRVEGIVQGVGFRPHVYRLAQALGLAGFVLNDSSGVLIEVEGPPGAVRRFEQRLAREAPPLAVLETPPLTADQSPLAVLRCPPLTTAKSPLISLKSPTTEPPTREKL